MRTLAAAILFMVAIGCGGESSVPNPSTHNTSATPEIGNQSGGMPLACENVTPDCTCCYGDVFYQTDCHCDGGCDKSCSDYACVPYDCEGSGCSSSGTDCNDINDYTVTGACCQ
jgi:hypothetical protein